MADDCTHLDQIRIKSANQPGCQDCLATGGTWVELRLCVECGRVGCCDNSPNRHATKHFQATGHPIIRAYDRTMAEERRTVVLVTPTRVYGVHP